MATKKKSLFVIVNGKSAGEEGFRAAVKHLRKDGHKVLVRSTWEAGDAERYVREALEQKGIDTVVAAGGDGSINEVAQALVSCDAPKNTRMAVVPMGTANDFATGLGIPWDAWEALQLAAEDTASPVDVGTVNKQVFVNVATGGFGAEVTESTDSDLKDAIGGAAYILTGITNPQTISARDARIKLPLDAEVKANEDSWEPVTAGEHSDLQVKGDHAILEGKLLVLAVGNGRQAGGGVQLCPDAKVDDGLLDVTYVMNPSPDAIPKILMGLEDDGKLKGPIGRFRCTWLEVDCPDGLQINRDGEPMKDTHMRFEIQPKRLMLHMPKTEVANAQGKQAAHKRWNQRLQKDRPKQDKGSIFQSSALRSGLVHAAVLGAGVGIGWKLRRSTSGTALKPGM